MNNYNIPHLKLENFSEIQIGKYHYNYKTVDFLFNCKENTKKLLIVFHGRVHIKEKMPIFYKHNYEKDNVSVLSISDKLLETNRELHNVLYLSTNMIDYRNIYFEIINQAIIMTKSEKNIFYGTCSGSYTALYYGCIFNSFVVCANGYVFLGKKLHNLYDEKIYDKYKVHTKYIDIYETLQKTQPKHIYLYINKYDTITFDMNKNFILFCKKNYPEIITPIIHDNQIENRDPHDIFFPKDENFESIMENI